MLDEPGIDGGLEEKWDHSKHQGGQPPQTSVSCTNHEQHFIVPGATVSSAAIVSAAIVATSIALFDLWEHHFKF